jgi:hypothetical protein
MYQVFHKEINVAEHSAIVDHEWFIPEPGPILLEKVKMKTFIIVGQPKIF